MEKSRLLYYVKLLAIPIVAALILRFVFNVESWEDIWTVMSISFFLGLPYLVGVITIYLSKIEKIQSRMYQFFFPWIPIIAFFLITLILSLEGWACWIMILPIFLILSGLGGLTAGYIRLKKSNTLNRLQISFAIVLPLIASPIEQMVGPVNSTFKANTSIEINASKERIWKHVTRVYDISEEEDKGILSKWLGIPRPVRAELNYEGLHAERKAMFTGGLIFTETVTAYEHQHFMEFSIEPNTGEIPSTTFDEHVLIGGQYFDVLKGTYELKDIGNDQYQLNLWSEFEVNTTFNVYAGLWANWIMKDIQNNILNIVKSRCEAYAEISGKNILSNRNPQREERKR